MFQRIWQTFSATVSVWSGSSSVRRPGSGKRRNRRAQRRWDRNQVRRFEFLEPRLAMHGASHGGNEALQAEHDAVMALVKVQEATHVAIASGEWDRASTWNTGTLPTAKAKVWIPENISVTLDSVETEPLKTVRIDGTLTFDPDKNTRLTADTIVVDPRGSLIVGTAANPIDDAVAARIVIASDGAIDKLWDPRQLSRGLISHGKLVMHGDKTTSHVAIAEPLVKGSLTVVLAESPQGWDPGERIVITGTNASKSQDEELEIVKVETQSSKTVLHVKTPLQFNNPVSSALGQVAYVTNVSRNVSIQSSTVKETHDRGHVMVMHTPTAHIEYAGFYGLGRTDKRNPLHNVELDASGKVVDGTGKNQVGRYAVHFHRTGLHEHAGQAVITGSSVVDSPGWGIVNHSSNVRIEGNSAFDIIGAAFVTEAGDEIGTFKNNIAIRSTGSGAGIESRQDRQDFGHQGDGFWFQGAGIEVVGNIAAGQKHSGFVYFTRGLVEKDLGTAKFLAHNLADPAWADGKATIDVGSVPIRRFENNVAFASGNGFESWFHLLNAKHSGRSLVDGLKVWNTKGGSSVFTPYTNNTTLKNLSLMGNVDKPGGTAMGRNDVTRNIVYDNVRAEGFAVGIRVPVQGKNEIKGGYFNNIKNIEVTTAMNKNRLVTIDVAADQFGTLTAKALGKNAQYNIFLQTNFNPKERDITRLFNPDVILLGQVVLNGEQLYYYEQAADFVPFKKGEAADYVPQELINKTNQELMTEFGLAIGGIVAPASAVSGKDAKIHGMVGPKADYLPDLALKSKKYTNALSNYELVYQPAGAKSVKDPTRVNLQEGWNLISRNIGGHVRTFLVFGDTKAPEFQLDSKIKLEIHPLDLHQGFTVVGKIIDNSIGSKNFKQTFKDLEKILQTRSDGTQFVEIKFKVKDPAGNTTEVTLTIEVHGNAVRNIDKGFKNLPAKAISVTLAALMMELEEQED